VIVYRSDDNGELYRETEVDDIDPVTKQAPNFTRYEVDDTFTLNAAQCLGRYGDLGEILLAAKVMRRV
jgi:hypothetical protein